MQVTLRQRGRASVDFLVDLGVSGQKFERRADEWAAAELAEVELPDEPAALQKVLTPRVWNSPDFRVFHRAREWQLDQHGQIAIDAFDEIGAEIGPRLKLLANGPCTIEYDASLEVPEYWRHEFHRSTGGWEGHEYMGFVHGEIIHRKMVGDTLAGVIMQQRHDTARTPVATAVHRILEWGCGSGQYTEGLAAAYPDAELTGVDLSARQLEQCQRRANEQGLSWKLLQANAEATTLPGSHFDLVSAYAVLHELPVDAIRNVLAESFRLLKPGGALLVGDVKAYRAYDGYGRWKADFLNQVHGGDPHWREFCTLDLAAQARAAGFVEACWAGVGPAAYPFVLTARKPA